MGLDNKILGILAPALIEHVPKGGRILSLGFPDLITTRKDLERLFGVDGREFALVHEKYAYDSKRVHGSGYCPVDPRSLFFAAGRYQLVSVDAKRWQGSEVLANLNVPGSLAGIGEFDLILDCGTLEHCLFPGTCLFECFSRLKRGGLALHHNPMGKMTHGFWSPHPSLYQTVYGELLHTTFYSAPRQLCTVLARKTRNEFPHSHLDLGARGKLKC